MSRARDLRLGVDIGGTFTDLCILDREGIVAIGKTLTTGREPAAGVEAVLRQTMTTHRLDPGAITSVVHGTTLVTNALIERRGARTALLTTAGFRDVVEMGREHRYELYDLDLELPRPLVPRWLRLEVSERIYADGSVAVPLDCDQVAKLARELVAAGVEAVAVCFLHSHTNPEHERLAGATIAEAAPELRVALSSEVNPEIREYERASTTLANVYVQGLVDEYLEDLQNRLRRLGLRHEPHIMLSNGGVATVDTARRFPVRMLESGPAGGVLAAVAIGRTSGRDDQLAFDMGGTTAKVSIIEGGRPLVSHQFEVDRVYRMRAGSGLPVRVPVIDMIEIGAGGGSVARVDALGLLSVGPDSAGSDPGPVCYGRGGVDVTVTDADVVLGYLDPSRFLGGRMRLDVEAAREALREQIAGPMGISVADAAWGVHATVNESMANAARVHAVERGQDVGRLPVLVSGGNGPVHGPGVGQALGAERVVVPPAVGVLSALGFLVAPLSIDFMHSWHTELGGVTVRAAEALFEELAAQGRQVLRSSGVHPEEIRIVRSLEMRFVGQGSEIEIPVPAPDPGWHEEVVRRFAELYAERFGSAVPHGVDTEILTWRVTARGPEPETRLRTTPTGTTSQAATGERDAYFVQAGGYVRTPVYDRYRLSSDDTVAGPALIEEDESTLVLSPGMRAIVGKDGSICVCLREAGDAQ